MVMDRLDRRIITLLQKDGRLTTTELADQIGLSASPCARRLKRLEQEGFITGYHAAVSRDKMGLDMTIFVNIRLSKHRDKVIGEFELAVQSINEIINCHIVSGSYDYLLEVVCRNLKGYETFMRKVQGLSGVQDMSTSFAIRAVKKHAPLPLKE